MIIISFILIITTGSPIIFSQIRVGYRGRKFNIFINKKISSECRHALFMKAKEGYLSGRKIRTSTILLPLEGDVRAASDYWSLSIQSGGLLISPSSDWP